MPVLSVMQRQGEKPAPRPGDHARPVGRPARIDEEYAVNRPRLAGLSSVLAAALAAGAPPALAIDLGEPSVLSQQGQRLRVAIPFGSAPGERIPVTRFSVVSAKALDGESASPDAARFTIAKPERRNVVFVQSAEPVSAPRLRLVVSVAGNPPSSAAFDVDVPPPQAAPAEPLITVTDPSTKRVRRTPR